ncbi:MAG: hypothetical protein E7314_02890 [Clostridiales bacterium]|nr:hypothetical protein [Clostridiales bacterium]
MLKTFIRFYLHNDECEEREVTSRDAIITDIPETAFAYQFYDKNIAKAEDGELCYGMERNASPTIYLDCQKFAIKELRQLLAELDQYCEKAIVITPCGEIHPCNADDKVVSRYDLENKI